MCECNRLGTDSQVKEFENVLEKYKPYFFNIESEYIISKDQTKLEIKINFIFKDGDIKTHILNMEL